MKQLLTCTTICIVALFVFTFPLNAQQFKWVRGGGSSEGISLTSAYYVEGTHNMCTDFNGNVYALSVVGNDPPISADTFSMPAGAYGSSNNILITSYDCNGRMRWAKLIGSANYNIPYGITTDNLGHVYVAGDLTHTSSLSAEHIGYDTSITTYRYGTIGIIQFDTTGHYNWMHFVGSNTSPTLGLGGFHNPIAVDGANNVHYFCYMRAGVDLTFLGSLDGCYDLVYSSTGTYLSATRLNMGPQWMPYSAAIDPGTNKLYLCGEVNTSYFGGSAVDTFFAAAFDASRNLMWMYFTGSPGNDGLSGIILDQSKHLYISGGTQASSFSFNSYSVTSTTVGNMSVIMKTDTNGHVNWIKHCDGTLYNYLNNVTMLSNSKVAAIGSYISSVTTGTATLSTPSGDRYNPYFVITDTAGNFINIEQLKCDATGDETDGFAAASDRFGNLYIGGAMEDSVYGGTPAIPAYHTNGGNTDFFVAKYGYSCACTSTSVTATFTATGTHTVSATYTGTSTAIDSIVWTFGDGGHSTGTATSHIYGASGTYTICVTAYTGCGNDTHCSTVAVTVPTTGLSSTERDGVRVYPNPAKEELLVTGLTQTTAYRLLSIAGTDVQQGQLKPGDATFSLQSLPPGIYILELTNSDGVRNNVRVVKE